MGTTLIPAMATEQLVDNDRMLTKAYLDEKSPHREIALLTRETFVAMDEVGLLADIFSEELQKALPDHYSKQQIIETIYKNIFSIFAMLPTLIVAFNKKVPFKS